LTHHVNENGPFYRLELLGGKTNQLNLSHFRVIAKTGNIICPYELTRRCVILTA
jgi:hypothetical protein